MVKEVDDFVFERIDALVSVFGIDDMPPVTLKTVEYGKLALGITHGIHERCAHEHRATNPRRQRLETAGKRIGKRRAGKAPLVQSRNRQRDTAAKALAPCKDAVGIHAIKVARNLDGMDPDRIFAWGEGLGGGVALAVSALDERGLACTALANPLPSGLETLSPRVRGSVLMGTSLMDTVSDPKGQFAVFNGLECDRRHIIYAKYAHERINAFENEVVDFFNQTFYSCSLA